MPQSLMEVELQRSSDRTSTGTFSSVGCLLTLSFSEGSRTTRDRTTACTPGSTRVYGKGLIDPGEVSGEIFFEPGSTQWTNFRADYAHDDNGYYKIVWPSGEEYGFPGIITDLSVSSEVDDDDKLSFTIKIAGASTFTAAGP